MRPRLVSALAVAALALTAACGDDSDETDVGTDNDVGAEPGDDTAAVVGTATTDLGEVLVDSEGMTLYGFTPDADGISTCYDDCATVWPPLTVEGADVPDGLDTDLFSTTERDDGTFQLRAGDRPLYLFATDSQPGDVAGQGVQGVWFVVSPDGQLIEDDAADLGSEGGGY